MRLFFTTKRYTVTQDYIGLRYFIHVFCGVGHQVKRATLEMVGATEEG